MRRLKAKQRILQQERESAEQESFGVEATDMQRDKKRKRLRDLEDSVPTTDVNSNRSVENQKQPSKKQLRNMFSSSSLVESFKSRLSGSRFRNLNEELYTTTSQESFERFTLDPQLFEEYHDGFRHQVNSWPVNPVHLILEQIRQQQQRADNGTGSETKLVVADFGCGDAELAQQLLNVSETQPDPEPTVRGRKKQKAKTGAESLPDESSSESDCFQVHSFDLVQPQSEKTRDLVTACDMANVPLPSSSVDVGVCCLSLMGTNLADFVREAHRVLKPKGSLWIAAVQSRFSSDESEGTGKKQVLTSKHGRKKKATSRPTGETSGLQNFLVVLEQLGFRCIEKDVSNKMFFLLHLLKNGKKPKSSLTYTAKPCIYKRR